MKYQTLFYLKMPSVFDFFTKTILRILLFLLITFTVENGYSQLNGTYTVGSGGNYATIDAAINAINTSGVSGPVTFYLTDNAYTFTQSATTSKGVINSITGASATNTITFKPAATKTPVITVTADATNKWAFKLNGADYIIFDGSNTTNGTSKDMTITMAGVNSYGFYLLAGANTNVIKNCVINGFSNASGNYGINIGDYTNNDQNNLIQNNSITKCYYGVYIYGNASLATGNIVKDNIVGHASNYVTYAGIYAYRQTNLEISGNEVFNIINANSCWGINVSGSTSSVISRNKIHDIYCSNTTADNSSGSGQGIYLSLNTANPNITIKNNIIYHVAGRGSTSLSSSVCGIYMIGSSSPATTSGVYLYFNSIYLTLDATYGLYCASCTGTKISAGIIIDSYISGITMKNNLIRNSLSEKSGSAGLTTIGYGVYCSATSNPFVSGGLDYNIYYLQNHDSRYVGYGTADKTLASWKTWTGQEANSLEQDPLFTSTSNLHINPSPATNYKNGTAITGITDDFDGEARNNPPDIGADEESHCAAFTQASSINFSNVQSTQMDVSWTNGTGDGVIVIAKAISDVSFVPMSGTTYTANSSFGSGTQLGTGNYVVYNGTGTSVTVTNLTENTNYYFKIYEYKCSPVCYNLSIGSYNMTPLSGLQNTPCNAPSITTTVAASAITSTTANAGGQGLGGACSVSAKGVCWNTSPGPTVALATKTNDGAGASDFTSSITGLSPQTKYYVRAYSTNASGTNYANEINFWTLSDEPTAHPATFSATAAACGGQITLNFSAANTLTNGFGYLILMKQGSNPTGLPTDGLAYTAGNVIGDATMVAIVNSNTATSTPISSLLTSTTYYFSIIPFNFNGTTDATYNYRTSATILYANATTLAACAQLNGLYRIGTSGAHEYTDLPSAIADLNLKGVSGAVTFSLIDNATYPLIDIGTTPSALTINPIMGGSSTNTLTIKPAAGVNATIEIRNSSSSPSYPSGLILNGADYVTIDGSNNGSTSRNLTFFYKRAAYGDINHGSIIRLKKSGTDAATHNTVKNCIIKGDCRDNQHDRGIDIDGDADLAGGNNNNTFENNEILTRYRGFYIWGYDAANKNSGMRIKNNVIHDVSAYGIDIGYQDGAIIQGNEIYDMVTSSERPIGIIVSWGSTNTTVEKNKIHNIVYTGAASSGGKGIYIPLSDANPNVTVRNNMIWQVAGGGAGSGWFDIPSGICIDGSFTTGVKIYHNSIYISPDATYGLTSTNPKFAAGISIDAGVSGIDFRNNLIQSKIGNRVSTSLTREYAYYLNGTVNPFTTIDYNVYKIDGQLSGQNFIAYVNGAKGDKDLAAWKTYTGQEAHSGEANPFWVSPGGTIDIHVTEGYTGIDLSISDDIDGDVRTHPTIGADEVNDTHTLPVELFSFTGNCNGKGVIIEWTTASEMNNDYFTLEKSIDALKYDLVTTVPGAGTSNTFLNYSFADTNILNQTIYYRLSQTDFDGKTEIFEAIPVFCSEGFNNLDAYFNSETNELIINCNFPEEDTGKLQIVSSYGQLVCSENVEFQKGENRFVLKLSTVPSGYYIINLWAQKRNFEPQKFLITK